MKRKSIRKPIPIYRQESEEELPRVTVTMKLIMTVIVVILYLIVDLLLEYTIGDGGPDGHSFWMEFLIWFVQGGLVMFGIMTWVAPYGKYSRFK